MKALTSNYSGKKEFKEKTRFKMKDGSIVLRILPAFSTFTDNAEDWKVFHNIHFGYKTSEGKLRPFESPLETKTEKDKETGAKTKTVLVPDAALDRLESLQAALAKAKSEGNTAAVTALTALVGGEKGSVYNLDKNMHMNAMDLQGNIGELKIRYKAFLALETEIKRLKAAGIDPLSLDDGRYLVLTRSGTGNQTTFGVAVARDAEDKQIVSNLSAEVRARLESEIVDLFNVAPRPTAEEVAQIVAESDLRTGKSPACDRIFDARWKAEREAKNGKAQASAELEKSEPVPTTVTPAVTQVATLPAAPVQVAATVVTPVVKPVPATVAAAPVAVTAAKPVTAPKTTDLDALSNDDFFAMLGVETGNAV